MYESESDSESEKSIPERQIIIHEPDEAHKNVCQLNLDWNKIHRIQDKCLEIRDMIVDQMLQNLANQVYDLQDKEIKQNSQNKKLIMPVFFKKNQTQYVQHFVEAIEFVFKQKFQKNQGNHRKIRVIKMKESKISMIALKVHTIYTKQPQNPKILIINTQITDIQPENTKIFQSALGDFNCHFLLPTHHKFIKFTNLKYSNFEVLYYQMYENYLMFNKFIYNCIINEEITAYLPRESLRIFDQLKQFPISYKQACFRLIFCIKKLHILAMQKKIDLKYVRIGELFEKINESFRENKYLIISEYKSQIKLYEKNSILILDQTQVYNIPESFLSKNSLNNISENSNKVDQNQLIQIIRHKFKKALNSDSQLKQYIEYLQINPFQPKKQNKSRRRMEDRYKINTSLNFPEKIIFQEQIKKIIMKYTSKIRQQARKFKWNQFNYDEEIKPMIKYNIQKSISRVPQLRILLSKLELRAKHWISTFLQSNLITSQIEKYQSILVSQPQSIEHNQIENKNQEDEDLNQDQKMNYGRILFLIKQLQLYGMININSITINSQLTNDYYRKATFWKTQEIIEKKNFYDTKKQVWL